MQKGEDDAPCDEGTGRVVRVELNGPKCFLKILIQNLQGPKLTAKMKDQESHLEVLPLETPDDICPTTVSIQRRISGYPQNPGELTCTFAK